MFNNKETNLLRLSCRDQVGIVSKISTALAQFKCNIIESKQFTDQDTNIFFLRQSFNLPHEANLIQLNETLGAISKQLGGFFDIEDISKPTDCVIFISKFDHCLTEIFNKIKIGSLNIKIKCIISNHKVALPAAKHHKIPFYFLDTNNISKINQEKKILDIIKEYDPSLIILARYMQILSKNFVSKFYGKIINIHHSFLPSFKGSKPYQQAYMRGVKIIGATAHFVTEDLDEGPIIDQDIHNVDHEMSPLDFISVGRDIESRVLYRSIKAFTEGRIFLNGQKTIVFKGERKLI